MGRKRDNPGTREAKPPAQKQAPKRGDKPRAVEDALAKGIESPTAIADYLRREHGLEITPGHVTTIKGVLKRKAANAKGQGGRKVPPEQPGGEKVAQPGVQPASPSPAAGLTPGALAALADIAGRAGGID